LSNLIDIQSQIEKLQKQANEIKAKEFNTTVQDILRKMRAFGITVKDLQGGQMANRQKKVQNKKSPFSPKAEKKSSRAGGTVAPKYRGPNGETWSGRGLTPKWLSALIAEGKTKESFEINA
jgi:DNA-binding protein H-NS